MISDDAENRRKATAAGLSAYSVRTYVESLTGAGAALLDLLAVTGSGEKEDAAVAEGKRPGKRLLYDDVSGSRLDSHRRSSALD